MWLQRDLSLQGRTLLAKAEGLSLLMLRRLSMSMITSLKMLKVFYLISCGKTKDM